METSLVYNVGLRWRFKKTVMINLISLNFKKYGIAASLIINRIICIIWLSSFHEFEVPRIYLHLLTLCVIAFFWIKYPTYQRIHWKAMLILAAILVFIYYVIKSYPLTGIWYAYWFKVNFKIWSKIYDFNIPVLSLLDTYKTANDDKRFSIYYISD